MRPAFPKAKKTSPSVRTLPLDILLMFLGLPLSVPAVLLLPSLAPNICPNLAQTTLPAFLTSNCPLLRHYF